MAPSGRKHSGKAGKAGQEEQARSAYDFQEERKDLSGSEEDIREGAYLLIIMIFLYFIFYNVSKPEQIGGYYGSWGMAEQACFLMLVRASWCVVWINKRTQ